MNLPKSFDPKLVEEKWYSFWEKEGFFKADSQSKKEPYTIVIPPPNVTGKLHMGHALVDTIQDILIRWKRMQGFEALWVAGTDHAGIATQGVVEKMLFAKTGKRRKDFSREEFLGHVWDWKKKSEGEILNQVKKLGCSCDWSRLRFTMDEGCNRAVRTCFQKMFDEGLIYQGDYLVNWDPVTQTALSDDEVEHEERSSFMWHIRYPIERGGHLVIATTRPETMLGDTAVAVHPDDEKYKHLIGQLILLPLSDRKIPIIADTYVDPDFGTGAVKITPAHDFNDNQIGQRHNLEMINILTPDGKINTGKFEGLDVDAARKAVVEELQDLRLMEKIEPHTLRVGLSYRSKAVLQPYLSKQWFVKMSHFKEKLLSAVREKRVEIIPPHFEATYFHWIENLRDWCISRQLWWGHQIPVWYNKNDSEKMICYGGEGIPPEVAKNPTNWTQDDDVLDTWFSSALWPMSTLGWPKKTPEFAKFFPTSTLVTAHDILFFWVARMIMMGEYLTGEVPFKQTFMHGLIYGKSYWKTDEEGSAHYVLGEEKKNYDLGEALPKDVFSKWEKMSKTKGNVIDPIEMIDIYGTDAVRMTLASITTHARQIDLDQRKFEEYKNFANKVFNGARFVMMHIESLDLSTGLDTSLLTLEDRWIFSLLNRTIEEINHHFTHFAFDKAAQKGYEFFWNDFCSNYVELSKPILFGKVGDEALQQNKQKILLILLIQAMLVLHPIVPFITEEIFQNVKKLFPNLTKGPFDPYTKKVVNALNAPACMKAPFPEVIVRADINEAVEREFELMLKLVRSVRNARAEMGLPPTEKTDLYLVKTSLSQRSELDTIRANETILYSLTPTKEVHYQEKEPTQFGVEMFIDGLVLFIPIPESLKAKEKIRLEKELEKLEKRKSSTAGKLQNPEFRERAPREVVQKLESALQELESQTQSIQSKISQL